MVDAGKITLRVEVDAKEFEAFMKKSPQNMSKFEKSVAGAKVQTEKLGESATTTAVRFQTLTQGTINLVTSFTQAYTSISNLQKAKTSLQAAAVGVERAIDLQRRKQFMLNEEMNKAAPNMKKVELLTNELATAHDDLAVKQQRVKDQADQVNDTYILFGLNIANVGFSAVQTGVSMIKMAEGTKVAAAASRLLNISMGKWALIATAVIVAWEGIAQVVKIHNKEMGEAISIIDNVSKVFEQFGTASDITLDNYEDKIGSASGATKEFEDSWKSMTGIVKGETDNQIAIVKHWEREYKTVVANMRLEMARQIQSSNVLPGGTQGNFNNAQKGNSTEAKVQEHDVKIDDIISYIIPNVPTVQAEEQIKNSITRQDDNVYSTINAFKLAQDLYDQQIPLKKFQMMAFKHQQHLKYSASQHALVNSGVAEPLFGSFFGASSEAQLDKFVGPLKPPPIDDRKEMSLSVTPSEVEIQQAKIAKLQAFEQQLMDIYAKNGGRVTGSWYSAAGNTALEIIRLQSELEDTQKTNPKIKVQQPRSQDERNLEFLSTFIDENTPTYKIALQGMGSRTRHLFKQRTNRLKQISYDKFAQQTFGRDIKVGTQTIRVGITSDRIGGIFHAGTGSNLMAMTQNMGGTFGMGSIRDGTREGNMIEALRNQQMATIDPKAKRTGIDVSGMLGLNYMSNAITLSSIASSSIDGPTGLAFGQAAVASGAVSATAAYQNVNVATPRHIMKAIRNQDAFANGIGRYLENLTALLTGKKQKNQYRNSWNHKTQTFYLESRESLNNALDFGFRSNQDFVEKLNQSLVDIDPQSEGAVARARQNVKTSVSISQEFLKMQFGLLRGIGIESTTVSAIAGEIGLQGELPAGFLNNLQVLSQMNRSDFNNYDIIHESKNKLNMSNQEVFAIRFDAKRGDDELLDRLRFEDRLEAMSSGTSAF